MVYDPKEYNRQWRKANPDYGRCWYRKHAERLRLVDRENRERARDWLWALKSKPCSSCHGEFHPASMQFDHVRGVKEFEVNVAAVGHYSKARIEKEIEKCDLVCANCHAVLTWERTQNKAA
jgi:hypothetical protein